MEFDALIVGGGIVGCTHGWYLAQRGLKTAIIERSAPGMGTSARNFSWVNASTKVTNDAYHALNAASVAMYDALAQSYGADAIGLNPLGALGVGHPSDPTTYKALCAQADGLARLGYDHQWLDTDALRDAEPELAFADGTEALSTPTDKCLNTRVFIDYALNRFRALGGQVIDHCAALEIETDADGAVCGLVTAQGAWRSPRVILAAGPDTAQVLSDLTGYGGFSSRFPVNKVPGMLVTTPPLPDALVRHLIYTDLGGEFHVFPDFNGGLRLASDDVDGQIIDDQTKPHLRAMATSLLQRMRDYAPDFAGPSLLDDCEISIGVRAYPEDGVSIAGALPGAQGLYVIATHSGVTLAPVLGRLMADLIVDDATPAMLRPFGLDRLPGFA